MLNNNNKNELSQFHNIHEKFTSEIDTGATNSLLPDRYVFILSNICNLRCPFCFQKKDRRSDAMTTKNWIDFATQLPLYARVTLTGGEPLIFPGFREVFDFVAKKFDCNIVSNGIALSPNLIDFLLSYAKFKVLSISIDDIGNTVRNMKPNQWEHIEKMIDYFVKKRKTLNSKTILDVKTVVLDENAHDLLKIHRLVMEKLKADTHMFQFLKGSPIQHADYMFNFDHIFKKSHAYVYKKFDIITKQLEKIRRYNLKYKTVSFLHPKSASMVTDEKLPDLSYLNDPYHKKENFLPCKFPWSSMHINVDGTVFPCLAVSMGNVKHMNLKEIWESDNYIRFRNVIHKAGTIEACNRCGWIRPKDELLNVTRNVN